MASDQAFQQGHFISITESDEIEFWTRKLGVSKERLEEAVHAVGPAPDNIRAYLNEDALSYP